MNWFSMFKYSVLYITPVSTRLCLLLFTRARSGRKLTTAALSGLKLSSFYFPVLKESKSIYAVFVGYGLFSAVRNLSEKRNVARLSLLYRHFHRKFLNELHTLVPPTLMLSCKTLHAAYFEAN